MEAVKYYPVYLNLKGKKVLVVGAGEIGFQKAQKLVEADAEVTVLAKEFSSFFQELPQVEKIERAFDEKDVDPYFLVIGATSNSKVNHEIYEICEKHHKLVNIVDVKHLCRFIVPAVVKRGDLLISVSTGGTAPFVAKFISEELKEKYHDEYAVYVDVLGEARHWLKDRLKDFKARLPYFQKMLSPEIRKLIFEGKIKEAKEKLKEIVDS